MAMAPGNQAITGGTVLRAPAIQSPDYVAGTSGWIIRQDGSAEFNSGTFRGSIEVGSLTGAHFVVNNTSTGDVIDVYNSANKLVFSIDAAGNMTSYAVTGSGAQFIRSTNGTLIFNNATGYVSPDPPAISAPIVNSGGSALELYSGDTGNVNFASTIELFGGANAASAEIRATTRGGVTGDVLQTDTSNNDRQLVHAATYSGTVSGGDGHWVFAHGALFTPKVVLLTPYAAGGGDGAGYVRMWTNFADSSNIYTIWTDDGGGRTANGTTVGVNAVMFG